MKLRRFVSVPLFLLFLFAFSGCGPTRNDAVSYNDHLVQLQIKAYRTDDQTDEIFWNTYSYSKPEDAAYRSFVKERKEMFEKIISEINVVEDLSGNNGMKTALMDLVRFQSAGLDNYYTAWLQDTRNEAGNGKAIIENYNSGFIQKEQAFLNAQKALAERFSLSLVEESSF